MHGLNDEIRREVTRDSRYENINVAIFKAVQSGVLQYGIRFHWEAVLITFNSSDNTINVLMLLFVVDKLHL